ncbi:hypothetical protein AVEN_171306-1 [Araneus ventricosus]|uniref:Uncharacterized protein n=2 Tax=Araneus ventricosus TaxID=182803 RepID=A0A4Y2EAW8_ARAVE|nr:hypothetical protein AVEN_171306-1 [Araneus ventricosus]
MHELLRDTWFTEIQQGTPDDCWETDPPFPRCVLVAPQRVVGSLPTPLLVYFATVIRSENEDAVFKHIFLVQRSENGSNAFIQN